MKSCFLHKNLYFTGLLQSIRSRLKLRMQIKFFRFFKIIYYILQIIFSILHLQHGITLKRVSKRSSFRYRFQEHLLKFLMLAVTDSATLFNTLNSKLAIIRLVTSVTNPLYLPNTGCRKINVFQVGGLVEKISGVSKK
jgi:hypothetical protein